MMEEVPSMTTTTEGTFCLHQVTVTESSEDDYQYEEVPADDDFSIQEGDEDLAKALHTMQEQAIDAQIMAQRPGQITKHSLSETPEVVDDFLCNFLIRMGMNRTLDCFQTEWYELMQRGMLEPKDIGFVPDAYTCNQQLERENKYLRKEMEGYKFAANQAKEALVKVQKERDFHRMHHKRVVQEKNRLINDIKRLKAHYASYEPMLRQLKEKYETLLREKVLTSLERDRAVGQITGLQATLQSLECGSNIHIPVSRAGHRCEREDKLEGPSQKALREAKEQKVHTGVNPYDPAKDPTKQMGKRFPKDSEFPEDIQVNPYLARARECVRPLKSGVYRLSNTLKVHDLAVSCLALHPRKDIVVTGSDDRLWKMWAFPNGNIIMKGEGHTDWLSGCCFHPSGTKLATSSGDTTVRIWDFAKGGCILTLEGHSHAAWDCSWHSCGDFVASASMDKTSKVWDLNSERCRYTLRGHKDSVNSIEFLPFSNIILTSSADKTLSLWDARTGLCAQTFCGHLHSCNHATFNMKGDTIVSCDSYGVLKLWDIRKGLPMVSIDAGPHPGNHVTFDPSGRIVALASNDGTVKTLELKSGQLSSLLGHEDEVQSVTFDHKAEHLLSGGSDGTVRIWN
ncbi:sperm-associated antigen 16 protein isoform X1 [Sceloporus undulatus]|uniref:sperm-associated antigen 16 protein isoform X1 n=2 Tax=Sceloporus undulatus TaxID=8520 RepID=UPI001C4B2B04|nr:sperm-associated antigen 16 protein isoform X1 [Sceloporus undulatus]